MNEFSPPCFASRHPRFKVRYPPCSCSGVSLDSFQKKITVQNLSYEGLQALGPTVTKMAEIEGLEAHKRAVSLRLEKP